MKFALFSFLAFLFLFVSGVSAKPSFNVEIVVKDSYNGKPIPNVKIIIAETNDTLYTDSSGNVFLSQISQQSIRIDLSHDAYLDRTEIEYFKKRQRNDERFIYQLYPGKDLFNQYYQTVIDEEMAELHKIDSTKYLPCDQDSTPYQLDTHFPGGMKLFKNYINSNIQYPEKSIDMDEQGKVYMSFVVGKDGHITNIRIERGVSRLLDREAKRLIKEMPNWIPQYCNGRPQVVRIRIPLIFSLN
jgi:TonB family protein